MKKPAPKSLPRQHAVDCSELIDGAVQSAKLRRSLNSLIAEHGCSAVVYELANAVWQDADLTLNQAQRKKKLRAAYVLQNVLHRL